MEYEYGTSSMPYKYMRMAIQAANPAGGWTTPIDVAFWTADSSGIAFLVWRKTVRQYVPQRRGFALFSRVPW